MLKLELTEAEFKALCALMDAGVRSVGLKSVKDAAAILIKLEIAQRQIEEPRSGDTTTAEN